MIANCTNPNCKSSFQDKEYGFHKRIMNLMGINQSKMCCTVCKTVYDVSKSKIVEGKLLKEVKGE